MAATTQDLRNETQQVETRLGDRLVQQAVRHNIALQEQSARYDDRDDRIQATLHEMMQIIETLVNGRAPPVTPIPPTHLDSPHQVRQQWQVTPGTHPSRRRRSASAKATSGNTV